MATKRRSFLGAGDVCWSISGMGSAFFPGSLFDERPEHPACDCRKHERHDRSRGKDEGRVADDILHGVKEGRQGAEAQGGGDFDDSEKIPLVFRVVIPLHAVSVSQKRSFVDSAGRTVSMTNFCPICDKSSSEKKVFAGKLAGLRYIMGHL